MNTLARTFTGLAALAFMLAVVANFSGPIMGTGAEAFLERAPIWPCWRSR